MAIFEKIQCSVVINDVIVPEYDCPTDPDTGADDQDDHDDSVAAPVIEKYIESHVDQNFALRFDLEKNFDFKGYDALECRICLDGEPMTWPYLSPARKGSKGAISHTVYGPRVKSTVRKFRFSKLMTDDIDNRRIPVDTERLKSLGDIEVSIYRVDVSSTEAQIGDEMVSVPRFSEKAAKGRALDSFTTLDEPVPSPNYKIYNTTRESKNPVITFVFHYRSIGILQHMDIVEKPLSIRSLEDKDPASLTPEEVLELVRRQKELLQQQEDTVKLMKTRLRQEQARHNLMTLDAIKRARSPSPRNNGGDPDDEELQIVKRARKDRKIEVIELD